jgi:hypothetical protein
MKANKTMKRQAIPNHRRKGKKDESNVDSAAHNQTLKQQKQLMTGITTYLIILTLNVNRLNSPIKRHHFDLDQKGRSKNLVPTGDPPHQQKQALAEGKRLEEDLPSQWPPKTGRGSNTYLGQSRLQTYIDQTR